MYELLVPEEVRALLDGGAAVAFAVSGGKDSCVLALALTDHLDRIGHAGPRLLIHSDLGRVEWRDSLPTCQRLADRLKLELVVVRRAAGDLMARWEGRWQANLARYAELSCVKLILPWSTSALRFCTSELKSQVLCAELSRRFRTGTVLSALGLRAEESARRASAPVFSPQPRLSRKNGCGYTWNPILSWRTPEVYAYLEGKGFALHEAYRCWGCTRVSCCFCIMGSAGDLAAATRCPDNRDIYRLMVDLESRSTFAFQSGKWLADVAPSLLSCEAREQVALAKERAALRERAEARIPKHLLYQAGWPTAVPEISGAEIIARARREVAEVLGIAVGYTTAEAVRERYAELMALARRKEGRDGEERGGQLPLFSLS